MILLIASIIGSVVLDQLTKQLAVIYLQGEASFPLWKNVLHFTYAENRGAAFGMLSDQRWIFMVVSSIAIIGLLIFLICFRPKNRWVQISLAMIVGGGIGNMIDRILLGYVIDFIDFTLIDFAIFNVADSFVTVGAFMLMGYLIWDMLCDYRAEREKKAAQPSTATSSSTDDAATSNTETQDES